ncbi:putative mucin-associated surface protein (MASP) [Trypanosoma grayi]|uniref:putative mucin-associated surface protein (MASP) n=1 Tax=Trypanosoma grayi TaxID=71804 RepID=UPI0004F441C7|nr:putative mucin-associated surface protein (MASP) [Trypanosoma grayi]KEG07895.1 putative mucin-associated surface protein (MASP) [Trypanosoma grayi]
MPPTHLSNITGYWNPTRNDAELNREEETALARFGHPGLVPLYAVQLVMDVDEEMCFASALHACQGVVNHGGPSLFMHVVRQLLQVGPGCMACGDCVCVGGLLVDYLAISSWLVEAAWV